MRTEPAGAPEGDVLVEERPVEGGRAVRPAHVLHHRAVAVVALVVPRQVDERRRERLLPRRGEQLPERRHRGVVFLRERLHARRARDGPGVLPKVEVVAPALRGRQHAVHHAHRHVADRVAARLRVRRHLHLHDLRAPGLRAPHHAVLRDQPLRRLRLRRVLHVVRHARLHREARRRRAHALARRQPRAHRLAPPRGEVQRARRQRAACGGAHHEKSLHARSPFSFQSSTIGGAAPVTPPASR